MMNILYSKKLKPLLSRLKKGHFLKIRIIVYLTQCQSFALYPPRAKKTQHYLSLIIKIAIQIAGPIGEGKNLNKPSVFWFLTHTLQISRYFKLVADTGIIL